MFYDGDQSCQVIFCSNFGQPNLPYDCINNMAKNNYSGEKKRRGTFRWLMARPFLALGWIAAGFACLLLAVFVFYPHRNAPMSLLSNLKTGPKIIHTKIPEELRIAQNVFRGKIPTVDQPANPPTKIESVPPVEKEAVPSQPIVASPVISEPQQKTELVRPVETQTRIETTPPMAQAVPSQPTETPPENAEPRRETELVRPTETQSKIETTPAVAQAVPISTKQKYARSRLRKMSSKKRKRGSSTARSGFYPKSLHFIRYNSWVCARKRCCLISSKKINCWSKI